MSPVSERRVSAPLLNLAAHGCLIARDAAYNLRDYISSWSQMAAVTVRQCEQELDTIERDMDNKLPLAMVRVREGTARELLASIRFVTDLERIGDLLLWVAERSAVKNLDSEDKAAVINMLSILEHMLQQVHRGLLQRDLDLAASVLRQDHQLDRIRRDLFDRHLQSHNRKSRTQSIDALFIVQSIERAGDHATNLAEELVHLIEHRSIRHTKAKEIAG
jgi:phosphate transport system protein